MSNFFTALIFSLVLSSSLATVRRPQPQPESYNESLKVCRENFESSEKTRLHLNKYIPEAPIEGLRVVTYNIHYHRNLWDTEDNVENVMNDVKQMNADVMLFQEVLTDTELPARKQFDSQLRNLGYKFLFFANAGNSIMGNMIASKYPLVNKETVDLGYKRVLLKADIQMEDGSKLALISTHWQNADPEARVKQSEMTVDYLKKLGRQKFILGADFNDDIQSESIKNLLRSNLLKSSFSALKWPHPRYTCWAGYAIDFLWIGNQAQDSVTGSYMYHTLSSDHLPIIVDMSVKPSVASGVSTQGLASSAAWHLAPSAVVLILSSLFYLF